MTTSSSESKELLCPCITISTKGQRILSIKNTDTKNSVSKASKKLRNLFIISILNVYLLYVKLKFSYTGRVLHIF
jgi:hypothetical protein